MTFYAFLDESGDEGFTFSPPPNKRGNEWFVLSAVVIDDRQRGAVTAAYQEFKTTHRKQDNWHFHFVRASHDDRLGFLDWMCGAEIACMSMLVHKPSIKNRDAFSQPYALYHYSARILFERISWYCIHIAKSDIGATPDTHLIFSTRRGLTKANLQRYLYALGHQTDQQALLGPWAISNSIHWSAIEPQMVSVVENSRLIGLQMADAVASSVAKAVEMNTYGMTEHRYVKTLQPVLYKRGGTYRSYGLKFFPHFPNDLSTEPRFHWLNRFK